MNSNLDNKIKSKRPHYRTLKRRVRALELQVSRLLEGKPLRKKAQKRGSLSASEHKKRKTELDVEILFELHNLPDGDGRTMTEIAALIHRAKQRVCERVNWLWSQGYLRRPRRGDGYRVFEITDRGEQYLQAKQSEKADAATEDGIDTPFTHGD